MAGRITANFARCATETHLAGLGVGGTEVRVEAEMAKTLDKVIQMGQALLFTTGKTFRPDKGLALSLKTND